MTNEESPALRRLWAMALAILGLSLQGCDRSQRPESFAVQGSIIRYVQESCPSRGPCTLRIRDLTKFEWEKMYVFAIGSSRGEREQVVGLPGVETVDLEGEMVFTKAGEIVHQEPMPEGTELPLKNEIGFAENSNSAGYVAYSSSTLFSVEVDESKNGRYFVLSPIK